MEVRRRVQALWRYGEGFRHCGVTIGICGEMVDGKWRSRVALGEFGLKVAGKKLFWSYVWRERGREGDERRKGADQSAGSFLIFIYLFFLNGRVWREKGRFCRKL